MKQKLLTMRENIKQPKGSVSQSSHYFPDGFFSILLIRSGWRPPESADEEKNPSIFTWN
jgi:hypothetical protein